MRIEERLKASAHSRSMGVLEWNRLIEAHFKLRDTATAMREFEAMKSQNIAASAHSISIVLDGLTKNGAFDEFERFLSGEVLSAECAALSKLASNDTVLTNIVHGLSRSGLARTIDVARLWRSLCRRRRTEPNLNALSVAIVAAAQSKNERFLFELTESVATRFGDAVTVNGGLLWNQMLCAFLAVDRADKAWTLFEEFERGAELCAVLKVLATLCSNANANANANLEGRALSEAKRRSDEWTSAALCESFAKAFYRSALRMGDADSASRLRQRMATEWPFSLRAKSVRARFECDGVRFCFRNGDGAHSDLVDAMCDRVGFESDAAQCPELSEETASRRWIRAHAEKRALCFCLRSKKQRERVEIDVDLRMCTDCHRFFKAVSAHFPETLIVCTDPRKRHIFQRGECSCGK